jgi:hypothetical protein
MLLSPRPTALLPSTDYSPVTGTKASRPPYVPREDGYIAHSGQRPVILDTSSSTMVIPVSSVGKESPRQSRSRKETNSHSIPRQELSRAESATSIRSRDSTSSMNRTVSRDSIPSMKRSISRESNSPRRTPRQFIVKSKASRSNRHLHLARTPSIGKGMPQMSSLAMTHTSSPKRESKHTTSMATTPSAGNFVRRKALSMSTGEDGMCSPPIIRRTLSEENGTLNFFT